MQVELEDQPPVAEQEQVDEQVQDATNVGYREGLLPEEDTMEHQWRLQDKVMAAFSGIFNGYEQRLQGPEPTHRWNPFTYYGENPQ